MKKLAKLLSVVLAVLMVFSCIPTTMGAFALDSVIPTAKTVVLNAADDLTTLSYPANQAMHSEAVGSAVGHTPTNSYITAKYHGTDYWNDWASLIFQLSIPDGESISDAEGIAVWVDYSEIVGKETWRSEFKTIEGGNDVLDHSVAYLVDINGNVRSVDNTAHGIDLVGYKGWVIYKIADGTDLSGAYSYGLRRDYSGCGRTTTENANKPVYVDSITAVMNVDEFIAAQKAASLNNAVVVNDFNDIATVTSSFTDTKLTNDSIDGSGLSFKTTRNQSMTVSIPETNLGDYEALAFYVKANVSYTFVNFKDAAGNNITNVLKDSDTPATTDCNVYGVDLNGNYAPHNNVDWENGYLTINNGEEKYVIVRLNEGLGTTNAIKFTTTGWHASSAENTGIEYVVDDLMLVKDINVFGLGFEADNYGRYAATEGFAAPAARYTDAVMNAATVSFDAVEGAASYDVNVFNGALYATVNTTKTSAVVNTAANAMIQVVAKDANGKVLAASAPCLKTLYAFDDNGAAVLNDGTDASLITLSNLTGKSSGVYGTVHDEFYYANVVKFYGTAGWNTWGKATFGIQYRPENLKDATHLAMWVDFTQFAANEAWSISGTGIGTGDVYTRIAADGTVETSNYHSNGVGLAGFKGWLIAPVHVDLTAVDSIGFNRCGYISVDAESVNKTFYVDQISAIFDLDKFIEVQTNPALYQEENVVLNDFDNIDTIVSSFPNTNIVDANCICKLFKAYCSCRVTLDVIARCGILLMTGHACN